jgi:V-type H+-transporting ATPase subunit A
VQARAAAVAAAQALVDVACQVPLPNSPPPSPSSPTPSRPPPSTSSSSDPTLPCIRPASPSSPRPIPQIRLDPDSAPVSPPKMPPVC